MEAEYAQRSFILSDSDANRIALQLKAKYQDTPITKDVVKNFMLVQHFNQNKQQQLGKLFAQMLNLSPSFENADTIGHIKFNPE
ncbi:MAG TPA: hypothetical protein PLP33_27470 [Leptospiraceae bacterium]|nr:hypothetical protein [Leptospiraceae bacterium]